MKDPDPYIKAAAELAAKLRVFGGKCDVASNVARFDLTLKSGLVFVGCGIHGNGGLFRRHLDAILAHSDPDHRGYTPAIRVYLVHRWFGDESIIVDRGDVESLLPSSVA